jgi:hypothetical protein
MRLCVLFALAACTATPQPIASINPVIGDTSFIRAFGRFPTPADDATLRVRTHVGYVAKLLRTRPAPSPELRAARERLLDELDRYVAVGKFPDSETDVGLLPTFLDAHSGVRCAVADLVEASAGTAMMQALDRDHHNDYIAQIERDPRFAAWAATSGLTREELELIQPSYPPQPRHHIELDFTASYAAALDDAQPGTPFQLGLLGLSFRKLHDRGDNNGSPFLELDAAVGAAGPTTDAVAARGTVTTERTPLAYDVEARVGSRVHFYPMNGGWHDTGITAGVGVDREGARFRPAITVPIDMWYRIHVTHRTRVGLHGGPRFIAAGDRRTGWDIGVDAIVRNFRTTDSDAGADWSPRDLRVSLDVQRIADLVFAGVSIGLGARTSHGYWGGE